MCSATGPFSSGITRMACPWPDIHQDNTSVLSAALWEVAVGRDPLFNADGSSDPFEEEDSSMLDWAGLQMHGLTH